MSGNNVLRASLALMDTATPPLKVVRINGTSHRASLPFSLHAHKALEEESRLRSTQRRISPLEEQNRR
jgi:hypothetical protein